MPLERRLPTIPGLTQQSGVPAVSAFGSLRSSVPTMGTPRPKSREPNPLERLDFAVAEYAPTILRQPAVVAERPVALANSLTGGGASNLLKSIGDFGGANNGPGPIGSFFQGVMDGIIAVGDAGRAWGNSGTANLLAESRGKGRDDVIGPGSGGILSFFGLQKDLTVGQLLDEVELRGWRVDPKTGEQMSMEELQELAAKDQFAFGDRAMSSSLALDTLGSIVYDPLNVLAFVPGAGWVILGAKIAAKAAKAGSAGGAVIRGAARWARPITTSASAALKTPLRYGHGYLTDPAIAVLRSSRLPDVATSAADILKGSTYYASLKGIATAAESVLRGGAAGLGKFTGYKAPARGGPLATATALGGAYYKGAFRLQMGSVAAEYGSGAISNLSTLPQFTGNFLTGGVIEDGGTNLIHSALQNLNNQKPLSDNETFMLFTLVTMPTVPLVKEAVGTPGRAVARRIGDNDAVLIAKQLFPEHKGKDAINKLYETAGDGDIAKGREIIHWALVQSERGIAYKNMGKATEQLGSADAFISQSTWLNRVLGGKIERMRAAGEIRATARVNTFFDVPRKGEIVSQADRPFEWNASPEAILAFWGNMHTAWKNISPGAQKLGITALTLSKIVTKEMAKDARAIIAREAPTTGLVPDWVRDSLIIHMPGLLENPGQYGEFWARLAASSSEMSISGRPFTEGGRAKADNRVRMQELNAELDKLIENTPSANEVYHEAGILEMQQASGTVVDALARSSLRKVHSPQKVRMLRDDAAGKARVLRTEQKALAHIRNNEYTRNGLPKYKSVDVTVGYRGSTIRRNTEDKIEWTDPETGVKHEINDMFTTDGGHQFFFDPNDPTVVRFPDFDEDSLFNEDPIIASELIVKAVQLGGRVIVTETAGGTLLANHGFVEVARLPSNRPTRGKLMDILERQRDMLYTKLMRGDKSVEDAIKALDKRMDDLLDRGEDYAVGYYAYAGGDPANLAGLLTETGGEILGAFPAYKASNRKIKNHSAGLRLAHTRADRASLLVPAVDSIGPSPTSAESLFHGSSRLFDEFDNVFLSSSSLVGRGVYTTDNAGVALGYSGPDGNLYRVEIPENLKTYDLEKEIPIELHAEIGEALFEKYNNDIVLMDNIERAMGEEITGIGLFRNLFDTTFRGRFQPGAETLGNVFDTIVEVFKKNNYEGFTHIGGRVVGNVEHNVTVAFDAANVKVIERIDPKDVTPRTIARHELIKRRTEVIKAEMKRQEAEMEKIDQRAAELKLINLPENLSELVVKPADADALTELISRMRAEYPQYDLSTGEGMAFFDPADGLLPALQLERKTAQSILFDYGPLSKITSLYDNLFGPISSKRLSKMARTAVYNKLLQEGATTKQIGQILQEMHSRVREAVVGPLRTPYFRDITSLPAQQVNEIARRFLDDATFANIERRYGREGFHRLLDESSNEFVRRVDKMVTRGQKVGGLGRALREGYRLWTNTPVVGSGSRLISKQFYHIFRFMLDLRWHFLNLIEADMLAIGREGFGASRFGRAATDTGRHALLQHSAKAGIPGEFFSGRTKTTPGDAGPSSAMELFDVGLYLHNRNVLPIVTKNFTANRLRSVDAVLDELPTGSSVHRMLVERFGDTGVPWSKQLDDMMYNFDQKGVRETVYAQARKDGWTEDELVQFGEVLEKITELNQRSYDDMVSIYTGNLDRTRLERVLNSYWLYWPISYQIKATRWMFDTLLNRMAGKQSNMTGLYLFNRVQERYQDMLLNNPQFQEEMERNEDLWFAANMLFPATPMDIGASLNRGVRYATSLVAPEVIPPYIGIDGAEDVPTRMLEMGPVYTARFIQTIFNDFKRKQDAKSDRALPGRRVEGGPIIRPTP